MKKILLLLILFTVSGCKSDFASDNTSDEYKVSYEEINENGTSYYESNGKTYKYCVTVTGRSNNALGDTYFKVLTNDKVISFNTVNDRFFGSGTAHFDDFVIVEYGVVD